MMMQSPIKPVALDLLCPMHVQVSATGHITHIGPTFQKVRPATQLIGKRFLEVFRVIRPREVKTAAELSEIAGKKLYLELRDPPRTSLKGVVVPQETGDGLILNLAFGISVLEAVRDYELTDADFAATDLTIEMLYLVEAKSAAMDASRKLNLKLKGAKLAAEEQAITDMLTGLKNRRAMELALSRLLATKQPFALMQVDLDYFKAVNDTFGHAAGDHVLHEVARHFRNLTGDDDVVARVGGDEFVLLLPGKTQKSSLTKLGKKIIEALEIPTEFKGSTCRISGSIGTVIWNAQSDVDGDKLLDDADIALYASKRSGRAQQTFYTAKMRQEACSD